MASTDGGDMAIGERRTQFNATGATIVGAGIAAVVVSMLTLSWTTIRGTGSERWFDGTFGDLKKLVDAVGDNANWLTRQYFDWLAITVLVLAGLLGLAAHAGTAAKRSLAKTGGSVGLAGGLLTIYAYKADRGWGDVFLASDIGLYVAIGGFILIAIGSSFGSDT